MKNLKSLILMIGALSIVQSLNATSVLNTVEVVSTYAVTPSHVAVRSMCPDGATCITNGTVVELVYPLSGCLDQLMPVASLAENDEEGNLVVYLSARVLATKGSLTARCMVQPTKQVILNYPMKFGNVVLKNLENQ